MASPQVADNQTVTLSTADLQRLIYDATQGGGALPPGAFREDGEVFRWILEPTGRMRAIKDAEGKPIPGRFESVDRRVKRAVYLTYDTSAAGLIKGKRAAQIAQLDFYHPKFGWLRYGTKREVEVAENLGSGADHFDMVYTPIETEDDIASSSATMQGIPNEPPAASGLASFDDALAADPAAHDMAAAGGRRQSRA